MKEINLSPFWRGGGGLRVSAIISHNPSSRGNKTVGFTPKIAVTVDEKYMAVTGAVGLLRCESFSLRLRLKKSVANCCILANDVESDP